MKAASSISRRDFLARIAATTGAGIIASGVTPLTAAEPVLTSPWQIGCYTRPFDKFDWRTAFDAIAEAGFKYAGLISSNAKDWILMRINTPREEAAKIGDGAAERGLKLLSAYGDFSVANSLAEGIDGLQKLIDNCVAARCPNLLLGGVSDPKQYAPYFKAIAESCAYAAQPARLSIKPHGGQNATGPNAGSDRIRGPSNFRLWYDPGNISTIPTASSTPWPIPRP